MAEAPVDPAGDAAASAVLADLADRIRAAHAAGTALRIAGGGSKSFLELPGTDEALPMHRYRGVLAYAPAELVIEVRAGTPLVEIETLLAAHGQRLACEPPRFDVASTIGGVVSAGLSGPARPYAGAIRDHVLGVGLLSPAGTLLRFGGRVMKNVAGYDVSRLVSGAWGTLGPIATLALRVAPLPARIASLAWEMPAPAALQRMLSLARAAWPIAGAAHDGACLRLRLAGAAPAVDEAISALTPDIVEADDSWWQALRDLSLPGLRGGARLWRLSVPPAARVDATPMAEIIDWGGAQRWWSGDELNVAGVHARVQAAVGTQGNAQPMFAAAAADFAPLAPVQRSLQARIKAAFDPDGLFNPGCGRLGT